MHPIVNAEQAAAWNGPEGEHWADQNRQSGDAGDELTSALFAAAAIESTERVLDVGCGTGETTRLAARYARNGRVTGVDLSIPMLDRARELAAGEGATNISFEVGDAQVHPFASASFDVAISRFGLMFFNDPVVAFTNLRRALRPGGRLVFVCPQVPQENDWYTVPIAALQRRLDGAAAAGPVESGMFSLAYPTRLVEVLTAAGFTAVRPSALDALMRFGPDAEVAANFYLGSGPVLALLQQHGDLTREAARETLVEAIGPYQTETGIQIPGRHWLVTANRP
ncbi:class I SAM-dependent methyltransferase [Micromonospora sp. PLK6-60]|uniref:class I SAM-dependent methyltransferase n=1 Tax=Micromonospora sp. PLK6-60 TaxID=2873383 RepID=UPI001CA693F4|nr:class I SAM-dependent methyltransferase [Micromonospora sp. PLK6-60]MBY8872038.1 class I SAM-dependent methyltransferase [Micromonospora sp. PLK6-60]